MTIQSDPVPSDLTDAEIDEIYAAYFTGFVTLQNQRDAARALIKRDRTLAPTRETAPALSEREAFEWLCKKYVQRADERQAAMGLQYMTAETHDLAKEIALWADREQRPADPTEVEALRAKVASLEKRIEVILENSRREAAYLRSYIR